VHQIKNEIGNLWQLHTDIAISYGCYFEKRIKVQLLLSQRTSDKGL